MRFSLSARACAAVVLLLIVTATGCDSSTPLVRAGVELDPPPGWTTSKTPGPVPGRVLGSWIGPRTATFTVYEALPAPGATAPSLLEETANRLGSLPELRVVSRGTESIAGRPAARLEVVAPGTGGALAASGLGHPEAPAGTVLVPTRRVCLGLPRAKDTLWLVWHYPEASHFELAPAIKATLATLTLDDERPAAHSY